MLNEQAKVSDNEQPKLLSTDISDKIDELKREIGYLSSKIKYFRPKKKPVENTNKTNSTSNNETDDSEKQESTSTESPFEKDDSDQNDEKNNADSQSENQSQSKGNKKLK